MASIDKIYGNRWQHQELHDWLTQHNPDALRYTAGDPDTFWECLDSEEEMPLSNFPERVDRWLLENCPIGWVLARIREQYGLDERNVPIHPETDEEWLQWVEADWAE